MMKVGGPRRIRSYLLLIASILKSHSSTLLLHGKSWSVLSDLKNAKHERVSKISVAARLDLLTRAPRNLISEVTKVESNLSPSLIERV